MTSQQLTLPFGHQFAEDRASLVRAIRIQRLKPVDETFLLYVHDVSRDGRLQKTYTELADRLGVSYSTARRSVGRCLEAGLLVCEEDRYRTGGQRENAYMIDWDGVRAARIGGHSIEGPAAHFEHPPVHFEQGAALSEQGAAQNEHPYKEIDPLMDPLKEPPPPKKPDGGGGFSEEWGGIRTRLRSHGLADTPGAIRAARDDGLAPAAVAELIDQWEAARPAWDVGGLYWKITRGTWPEKSEEYVRAQRDATLAEERRRQRIEETRRQQHADQEAAAARELEARTGPVLDSLPEAEVVRLIERVYTSDFEQAYARRNRASPLVRHALLQAIDGKQEAIRCE